MICEMCGQETVRGSNVTRSYDKGEKLFMIENVPMVSCSHCSASYFTAETLHENEQIKLHREGVTRKRSVPVVTFIQECGLSPAL